MLKNLFLTPTVWNMKEQSASYSERRLGIFAIMKRSRAINNTYIGLITIWKTLYRYEMNKSILKRGFK